MQLDTSYTLKDARDNQTYYVAKLKDGNVWMTQNLKLGKTTTSATLTTTDSDVQSTGFTLDGKLADGKFTYTTVDGTNFQNNSSQYYCTDDYGCYYNWYTATAGAGTTSVSSGSVDYSICPKGWTLPTGGSGGQFEALSTAYGSSATNLLVNPTSLTENTAGQAPGLLLGGSYGSDGANDIGSNGYYWPRTTYSKQYGYFLRLNTSSAYHTYYSGKYSGFAVRCLLKRNPLAENGVETMQDLGNLTASERADAVNAMPTDTSYTLRDSRDNQTYSIAKLKDGNVWLQENLRLDISDPTVQSNLTSTTTNATDTTLGYLKNGGGSSPYPANGVIAKTASSGSWTDDYANPYIATQYKDTVQAASGSSPAGKIGIYYNYCAASAGSYCYASGAGTGNASQDICPKGWRLPTGGSSGEYQALYTAYSSNANFMAALSTPLSGYFYSGSAYNQGSYGDFWSSTRGGVNYMYNLDVDSSSVYPQSGDSRYYGFSVRCVLQ